MPEITITLPEVVIQEILIALRDRAALLQREVAEGASGLLGAASIANIARRQLDRVDTAGLALASAVGERF